MNGNVSLIILNIDFNKYHVSIFNISLNLMVRACWTRILQIFFFQSLLNDIEHTHHQSQSPAKISVSIDVFISRNLFVSKMFSLYFSFIFFFFFSKQKLKSFTNYDQHNRESKHLMWNIILLCLYTYEKIAFTLEKA